MISPQDLVKLSNSVVLGVSLEDSGVKINDETKKAYADLLDSVNKAPKDVTVEAMHEVVGDEWDDLIAASDAAHGGPKTLTEMLNSHSPHTAR